MNHGYGLLCFLVLHAFQISEETEEESVFKKKLLNGYDKTLSPFLLNSKESMEIIWMSLKRIQDLDEATSTLSIEATVGMAWQDERLGWNHTEYQRRYIGFSLSEVWTPNLWILNHVKPEERLGDTRVLVFRGNVWTGWRYAIHTSCVPSLKYFPFDTQTCDIEFGAIAQPAEIMELNTTTPTTQGRYLFSSVLVENTRWKFLTHSLDRVNKTITDEREVNIERFTLRIQRTTPLIAMAIMTPSVMSVITVLSAFWISPSSPVRMGILLSGVFVSTSTLYTLGKVLPVTGSETPIIVEYSATSLVLILLLCIHTILVSLAIRSTAPFPIPYYTVLRRIPSWALRLLGSDNLMPKETVMNSVLLYSELTESDAQHENSNSLAPGTGSSTESIEPSAHMMTEAFSETSIANTEWLKPMLLFDKICFYVFVLIVVLYVVSVIMVE